MKHIFIIIYSQLIGTNFNLIYYLKTDGLVDDDFTVEIKCPYSVKDYDSLEESIEAKKISVRYLFFNCLSNIFNRKIVYKIGK